jgi:hypothetical protein
MRMQQAAHAALHHDPAPDPPADPSARLGKLLLGTDSLQRLTLTLLGLAALVSATVVTLLIYAAAVGVADARHVALLSSSFFVHFAGFYVVIRSGYNRRFSTSRKWPRATS